MAAAAGGVASGLWNNVVVVADEIHSDIIYAGYTHIPFPLLNDAARENCVLCSSPAKTFNIPGMKMSNTIIPNPALRERFVEEQMALSLDVKHVFGFEAVTAAYSPEGKAWLGELVPYIEANAEYAVNLVNAEWTGVSTRKPQGSFVCWLDFRKSGLHEEDIITRCAVEAGVVITKGSWFGKDGTDFMRMNIACPRAQLVEALGRIQKTLFG
jgi:cystathionine beta-lyase